MDATTVAAFSTVGVTLILAIAAVLIVHDAIGGATSADRAPILRGIAEVIRAARGRK